MSKIRNSQFQFSEDNGRVRLDFIGNVIKEIVLTDELYHVMGFANKRPLRKSDRAENQPDLKAEVHGFAIYETNGLLQKTLFGDKLAHILRYVTVRGKPGDVVEENFINPAWVPVLAHEIDELHFHIRTIYDKPMPFQWGTVLLTLVFKRALGI